MSLDRMAAVGRYGGRVLFCSPMLVIYPTARAILLAFLATQYKCMCVSPRLSLYTNDTWMKEIEGEKKIIKKRENEGELVACRNRLNKRGTAKTGWFVL